MCRRSGRSASCVSAADGHQRVASRLRVPKTWPSIQAVDDWKKSTFVLPGVEEKRFAVQEGRDLRVLVHPDQITDEQAFALARNIAL